MNWLAPILLFISAALQFLAGYLRMKEHNRRRGFIHVLIGSLLLFAGVMFVFSLV